MPDTPRFDSIGICIQLVCRRGRTCLVGEKATWGEDGKQVTDTLIDEAGFQEALPPAREFCRRFESEMGSTRCDEILESNLGRSFDLSRQAGFADKTAGDLAEDLGRPSIAELLRGGRG